MQSMFHITGKAIKLFIQKSLGNTNILILEEFNKISIFTLKNEC